MNREEKTEDLSGTILEEMVISRAENPNHEKAGLVVPEQKSSKESDDFAQQIQSSLEETERDVLAHIGESSNLSRARTWQTARTVVTDFKPVPWFIWRICNFVIGRPGEINPISDGMVFGLRRLMYAAASDGYIGAGEKVNDVRKALKIVPSDVVAAISVMHAICRKLAASQFERIWRPVLDDALLRARIGWMLGQCIEEFGPGRCMLAGFAGRGGLAILIASGELDQARRSLELLAGGVPIKEVGMEVYGCEPLQISAMTLTAAGCGRDAAYGTASYASDDAFDGTGNKVEQSRWLAAFALCEGIRTGKLEGLEESWNILGFDQSELREELLSQAKLVVRRGHDWEWLL